MAWLLATVCTAALARPAHAQSAPRATPEQIVARLSVTVAARSDHETQSLIKDLQAFRDAAIPAIAVGLSQGSERLSAALTCALGGIGGDASTSLLVRLLGDGPDSTNARTALGCLENRFVRRPLSAAELGTLTTMASTSNVRAAGLAARVLGMCLLVPAPDRLAPTLARFESEVLSPSKVGPDQTSYVSPRVSALNKFLLAISYVGKEAIPVLEQKRQGALQNSELGKWMTLALGMAGDESVADDLADMALGEPDRYVRWVAVRAYARSAKLKAIPLLETLLADTTESEYRASPDRGPVLLIRMAAKAEIFRLKQEAAGPTG